MLQVARGQLSVFNGYSHVRNALPDEVDDQCSFGIGVEHPRRLSEAETVESIQHPHLRRQLSAVLTTELLVVRDTEKCASHSNVRVDGKTGRVSD